MLVPIPYVHMGLGAAIILVDLPLVLRLVPPNRLYGVRLPEAFTSKRHWYAVNAYGGWWLLLFGVFLAAFGYLTRQAAPPPSSPWAVLYLVVPLAAIFPVLARIKAYARRLPRP